MRRRHVQYDTIHEPLSRDDLCDKMNNGTALCAYCDHYIASGLDRVDPTFGYTNENTVACCVLCNFSKTDFSVDVFVTKACDICQKWSHEIMQ
jgi:hypothetical protein